MRRLCRFWPLPWMFYMWSPNWKTQKLSQVFIYEQWWIFHFSIGLNFYPRSFLQKSLYIEQQRWVINALSEHLIRVILFYLSLKSTKGIGCSVSNCFIWECDCNEIIRHLGQQIWFLCCHELDILISILSLPQKIWKIMKNYQNFPKNENFINFFVKHLFQFFPP